MKKVDHTKAGKPKRDPLRGRTTMREPIYPFELLSRSGDRLRLNVGNGKHGPTEHQLRSAAWAYGNRNGFRVRTTWNRDKTEIIVTRITGRR